VAELEPPTYSSRLAVPLTEQAPPMSTAARSGGATAERLEFETLISDMSALLIAAPPEQVESAIEMTLGHVRTFFEADRCGLLRVSGNQTVVNVAYAAYAEGVPIVSGDLNLSELFPWASQRLLVQRLPVIVYRMAELPPEAAVDRASWEQISPMRSNLAVPICDGATVRKIVVLHWVDRECQFPDSYIPRLRLLGEMMLNALNRMHAFEALRTSEERLDRAAAAGGCGLWELDVPSRQFWVTTETRRLYGLSPTAPVTWECLLGLLHPDDRAFVIAKTDAVVNGTGVFDERYRIVRGDGAVRWVHVTARGGSPTRLEGASTDVTDIVDAERRTREALEEVKKLRDRLEQENIYLRREVSHGAELIIGRSPAIRQAIALAEQVAPTTSTVLLLGATGTGKERFASFIHLASARRERPMVRVNCSAIPSGLIESELFGREKGAYTGAMSKQIGRFELAHGSTLFLDEVGELPLDVQVKLLRVLQEHTIERLGSPRPIPVDVRIIAATNRDLEQAVRDGQFRSDLFYRVNVFPIMVPPLRDRREDLPALVAALVEEIGGAMGKRFDAVAKASLEMLQRYDWPGNVRELRNVLERAMILSRGPMLRVDLPGMGPSGPGPMAPTTATHRLEDVEREHILHVLVGAGWRIKGPDSASVRLGLNPSTLRSRMKKLGIVRPS
jgi:transcriptional regulator with GAF, ATPase, and Fis domain